MSEAETLTIEVKDAMLKSGASLVGVVRASVIDAFPKIWVGWTIKRYTEKTTDCMPGAESIVVIGYHVWDDMLEMAIRRGEQWVYPGYSPLDYLQQKAVNYLQKKNYIKYVFYN
jgi:hypothetical protein